MSEERFEVTPGWLLRDNEQQKAWSLRVKREVDMIVLEMNRLNALAKSAATQHPVAPDAGA